MKILLYFLLLIVARIIIFFSGKLYIKVGQNAASMFGIPEYIIDLSYTLVIFVFPQLFISLFAILKGHFDFAAGIIVGYAVVIPGLLLPVIAIFKSYKIKRSFIKFEIIIIFLITTLFEILSLNNVFGTYDTIVFFIFFLFFITLAILKKKSKKKYDRKFENNIFLYSFLNTLRLLISIAVIIGSSYLILYSSLQISNLLKMNCVCFSLIVIPVILIIPHLIVAVKENAKNNDINVFVERVLHSALYTLLLVTAIVTLIKPLVFNSAFSVIYNPFIFLLFLMFTIILLPRLMVTRLRGILLFSIYLIFIVLTVIKIV